MGVTSGARELGHPEPRMDRGDREGAADETARHGCPRASSEAAFSGAVRKRAPASWGLLYIVPLEFDAIGLASRNSALPRSTNFALPLRTPTSSGGLFRPYLACRAHSLLSHDRWTQGPCHLNKANRLRTIVLALEMSFFHGLVIVLPLAVLSTPPQVDALGGVAFLAGWGAWHGARGACPGRPYISRPPATRRPMCRLTGHVVPFPTSSPPPHLENVHAQVWDIEHYVTLLLVGTLMLLCHFIYEGLYAREFKYIMPAKDLGNGASRPWDIALDGVPGGNMNWLFGLPCVWFSTREAYEDLRIWVPHGRVRGGNSGGIEQGGGRKRRPEVRRHGRPNKLAGDCLTELGFGQDSMQQALFDATAPGLADFGPHVRAHILAPRFLGDSSTELRAQLSDHTAVGLRRILQRLGPQQVLEVTLASGLPNGNGDEAPSQAKARHQHTVWQVFFEEMAVYALEDCDCAARLRKSLLLAKLYDKQSKRFLRRLVGAGSPQWSAPANFRWRSGGEQPQAQWRPAVPILAQVGPPSTTPGVLHNVTPTSTGYSAMRRIPPPAADGRHRITRHSALGLEPSLHFVRLSPP